MHDEHTPHDVDARLRAALSPGNRVSPRIVTQALERADAPRRTSQRLRYAGALVALAIALGAGAWQWRRPTATTVTVAPVAPLAITGRGSIVVVEHPDGRRWIVGPPPERRRGGNYVILLER